MFGIRKKQPSKAPEGFTIGLGKAEQGADGSVSVPVVHRRSTIVVWKAKDGWRWRLWAPNGKLTAESGESYKRRYDCKQAALNLSLAALNAKLDLGD